MTKLGEAPRGALLFARFAYPPNALGYCGPDQARTLLEYGDAGVADHGLVQLARGFEGAWPYLSLIAHANGIADPLHERVVEAYWVGNRLLDRVDASTLGAFLESTFRPRAGRTWPEIAHLAGSGGLPHHNFHVFGVYPWLGLLRRGHSLEPLRVLDRCRIRWGEVRAVEGHVALVASPMLQWDGQELSVGPARVERAIMSDDGLGFVVDARPGDLVALHWDWVTDRLTRRRMASLRHYTARALDAVNRGVPHPAPAAVLG